MVRSSWKYTLVLLATWVGTAAGQQPAGPAGATSGDYYLVVEEPGKPKQKCKVLFCWTRSDGHRLCQVQDVKSGEVLVIMDPPPVQGAPELIRDSQKPAPTPPPTRTVFNWGSRTTNPPGFPAVPSNATRISEPVTMVQTPVRERYVPKPIRRPPRRHTAVVSMEGTYTPFNMAKHSREIGERKWVRPLPRLKTWPKAHVTKPAIAKKKDVLADLVSKPPRPKDVVKQKPKKVLPALPKKPQYIPPPVKVAKKTPESKLPAAPPVGENKMDDPLWNPKNFVPKSVQKKFPEAFVEKPLPPAPPIPPMVTAKDVKMAPRYGGLPPGSRSVLAAQNGLKQPMRYLPVPVVTVPTPNAPPMPPPPQMPNAPQPKMHVNAFTPPMPQNGPPQQHNMIPGNPRQAWHPAWQHQPRPPMMTPQQAYAMQQRMGYPPQGYPQRTPMMVAMGHRPGTPSFPMNVSRQYMGPKPPNPFPQQPVNQVNYRQQQFQMPASPSAMPPMMASGHQMPREAWAMLNSLRNDVSPAQREWATLQLSRYDWQRHPYIVQGLLVAAKEDPAETVRSACVRALMRMRVDKNAIGPTMLTLRSDSSADVRQAAQKALAAMGITDNAAVKTVDKSGKKSGVVPASAQMPKQSANSAHGPKKAVSGLPSDVNNSGAPTSSSPNATSQDFLPSLPTARTGATAAKGAGNTPPPPPPQ